MLAEVLRCVLRPAHRAAGLYLEEDGVFLHLKRGDKILNTWASTIVAILYIQEAADKVIEGEDIGS